MSEDQKQPESTPQIKREGDGDFTKFSKPLPPTTLPNVPPPTPPPGPKPEKP